MQKEKKEEALKVNSTTFKYIQDLFTCNLNYIKLNEKGNSFSLYQLYYLPRQYFYCQSLSVYNALQNFL